MKLKFNFKKLLSLNGVLLVTSCVFIIAISVSLLGRFISSKRNTATANSIVFDSSTPFTLNPISFEKKGIKLEVSSGNVGKNYLTSIDPQALITNSESTPLQITKSITFKIDYVNKQKSWFAFALSKDPITIKNFEDEGNYVDYEVNMILDKIYTFSVDTKRFNYFAIVNLKGSGGSEMKTTLDYIQFDF